MNALSTGMLEMGPLELPGADGEVRRRKTSLLAILAEGLPALPGHLYELNSLLESSPVDLRRVAALIRSDPSLTAQLLRLCNSALFGLRRQVMRVEEAAILMGTERLRKLVFTCYLIQLSCERLAAFEVESFWKHSLATAMLSERLGRRLSMKDVDPLYLAGLLHDVGKLPLLMVTAEENSSAAVWLKANGGDSLEIEREYFGLDHCEVGRWLAINWNFDHGLVEAIESHHQPDRARFAPLLVGIASAADHFCEVMESRPESAEAKRDEFYRTCLPRCSEAELASILGSLRREYPLVLKAIGTEPLTENAASDRKIRNPEA